MCREHISRRQCLDVWEYVCPQMWYPGTIREVKDHRVTPFLCLSFLSFLSFIDVKITAVMMIQRHLGRYKDRKYLEAMGTVANGTNL